MQNTKSFLLAAERKGERGRERERERETSKRSTNRQGLTPQGTDISGPEKSWS